MKKTILLLGLAITHPYLSCLVCAGHVTTVSLPSENGPVTYPVSHELPTTVSLQELPPLPGHALEALSINNIGQVAGSCWVGDSSTAVVWTEGQPHPIPDGHYCMAISNNGVVCGGYESQGFIWTNENGTKLLESPEPAAFDLPTHVNDMGQVIGYHDDYDGTRGWILRPEILGGSGEKTPIPMPPGTSFKKLVPADINNHGVVVGAISQDSLLYNAYPFVYRGGQVSVLRGQGSGQGSIYSINDRNEMVGSRWIFKSGPSEGFASTDFVHWNPDGQLTVLELVDNPTLEADYPQIICINEPGEMVGFRMKQNVGSEVYTPIYWQDYRKPGVNLNHLPGVPEGYELLTAYDINDHGQVLGEALKSGKRVAYVLSLRPPPALSVDANRDGEIHPSLQDNSDATSGDHPFLFWLNDDVDRNATTNCVTTGPETEQDDKAGSSESDKNCNNIVIDCERDLEDLTRLWIYTQGLNTAFKNGELQLGLKWTDVSSGTPAIRLFRAVETNGGTAYLSDEQTAHSQTAQTGQGYGMAIGSNGLVEGAATYILPQAVFANLSDEQPKTYLLFEGVKAGKGQLKLVILKSDGTEIGEGPGVWMELDDIKSFYERHTVGDDPSETPATTAAIKGFAYPAPVKDGERDYILWVHGYNVPVWEKERWAEMIYKRTWHLGYKGRAGIYEWPCTVPECVPDSLDVFDRSEFRAWQSAAGLRDLLTRLKSAGYRVRVMAHSQGNTVASEALRQAGANSNLVHTFAACQGALAAHCFDPSAALNMPFPAPMDDGTPNVYAEYPEPGMSTPSPYFAPDFLRGSAGSFVNFYNRRDYALSPTGGAMASGSWETDNHLKPNQGYGYNTRDGFHAANFSPLTLPYHRYLVFSFVAEARSFALGAAAGVGGVFGNEVDLDGAPHSFGPEHVGHSAEFRSYAARRRAFWEALLSAFDIDTGQP